MFAEGEFREDDAEDKGTKARAGGTGSERQSRPRTDRQPALSDRSRLEEAGGGRRKDHQEDVHGKARQDRGMLRLERE